MKTWTVQQTGTLIGRIIRFGLGMLLAWVAFAYEEPAMYVAGAVVFATGFLKPRRCSSESCSA